MDASERSKRVLAVPEKDFLANIRAILASYRGRVRVTLKNHPTVDIVAKIYMVLYLSEYDCVVMWLDVGKGKPLFELLFYPKDIRNYCIFGVPDLAHQAAENETGEDCLASVVLVDA